MAEIYNFWTSQGFIQTSNLTRYNTNGIGTSAITTDFSELHKYPLPNTTVYPSLSGGTYTTLFGFNRGADSFAYQYMLYDPYGNSSGLVGVNIRLLKNNSVLSNTRFYKSGSNSDKCNTPKPTHFFICQPTSCNNSDSNTTLTIYNYSVSTINVFGSNYTTLGKGGFSIGFCTSNTGLSNSYQNQYYPSSNNIRILLYTNFLGDVSNLTNISEYDSYLEYICGKNINYTFEDDISQQGGGFGDGDNTTDNIGSVSETELNTDGVGGDLPCVLTSSLYNSYALTTTELQNVANVIYDNNFITALKNLVNSNPLESIISLKKFPCTVTGTTSNIIIGTYNTEQTGSKIKYQYKTVDCGTLYLNEKFGNFLDYNPHTKISIYLPFIGIQPIDSDLFMNAGLQVIYNINLFDGTFICNLVRDDMGVKNIMYTFSGVCAETYSLSQSNNAQITQAIIKNTVNIAMLAGASELSGGIGIAGMTAKATSAMSMDKLKDKYSTSGSYSGNVGYMNNLKPYLIIERPKIALPDKMQKYKGFPSYITKRLGDCTGFTVVDSINLSVHATEQEKTEIERLLKEGVII